MFNNLSVSNISVFKGWGGSLTPVERETRHIMATWFEITYTGEATEEDYARVAELAAQGYTSGELINDEDEDND